MKKLKQSIEITSTFRFSNFSQFRYINSEFGFLFGMLGMLGLGLIDVRSCLFPDVCNHGIYVRRR